MRFRQFALLCLCSLALFAAGCGEREPIIPTDVEEPGEAALQPGEVEVVDVEPIPAEEVGDNRYLHWTDDSLTRLLANGRFEEWIDSETPVGWRGAINEPTVEMELDTVKLGARSLKMTGDVEKTVHLTPEERPAIEDLRGQRVVFAAWVYTSTPDLVKVRAVDSWQTYYDTQPEAADTWDLVVAEGVIDEQSTGVSLLISLEPSDPPAVAYIDGATLLVREP